MRRGATLVLDDVSMVVGDGERWLVLGPNGSGKTSLLRVAALYDHPTSGVVEVLGERLGRTDVRELRRRVAYASAALDRSAAPVVCASSTSCAPPASPPSSRGGTATPMPTTSGPRECLERMGVGRVRRADVRHAVVGRAPAGAAGPHADERPAVVLLDEPSARLDLGGASSSSTPSTTWRSDAVVTAVGRRHPSRRRHPAEHDPRAPAPRRARCCTGPDRRRARRRRASDASASRWRSNAGPDGRFSAWARR